MNVLPSPSAITATAETMNSVLGKARLIIEAFTAEDDSLSLAEIVRRSGVAKASVHRLAQELLGWGLLERAGSHYRLGLRLFEIGQRVPRQRILREAALPYMEDLLLATQETVHFAIHDGLDVLYVEKLMVHRGLRKQSRVAGRLPLHCTATGKVILAFSPPVLFHEVLQRGLTPLTHKTVTQPGRLRAQIDKIRSERLAVEVEETRLGYTSFAVPVFGDSGALVGALSITAPTFRMNHGRFTVALRTAALGISRALQATG
ncbi:IclR family transcriptional regulator [Sinosporangium siamense]|uniref:IclR family transcriptional regulator n=1 Tax=Sinosporangium siamense TaxID=1367973 RepID=A0A919VBU2_9ACTN|nr:IclR family transcriptional regulator [Sinosporangium siamense]GII96902.1 IclR family transcriptional regulator [Sinosporangium siamense]